MVESAKPDRKTGEAKMAAWCVIKFNSHIRSLTGRTVLRPRQAQSRKGLLSGIRNTVFHLVDTAGPNSNIL